MSFGITAILARVPLVPALLVLTGSALFVRSAQADSDIRSTFEQDLKALPADVAENLRTLVTKLAEHGVPVSVLETKLREGLAKNIPPQQIGMVLSRITDNSIWIHEQISACAFAKLPEARVQILSVGNDALLGALNQDDFLSAIKTVCSSDDGAGRIAQAFELFSYVTNRLRASKNVSWPLALALLSRNESKAATNQLVLTLQDVFKARGNVESALNYATSRLKAGASLRAAVNEIKEQFLRQ